MNSIGIRKVLHQMIGCRTLHSKDRAQLRRLRTVELNRSKRWKRKGKIPTNSLQSLSFVGYISRSFLRASARQGGEEAGEALLSPPTPWGGLEMFKTVQGHRFIFSLKSSRFPYFTFSQVSWESPTSRERPSSDRPFPASEGKTKAN